MIFARTHTWRKYFNLKRPVSVRRRSANGYPRAPTPVTEVTGGVVRRGVGSPSTILLLVRGVDDLHELLGLQGSAADEADVDAGLSQQRGSVPGVHGAAVMEGD